MPAFTVPNSPDTTYGDLAEPDARDFETLGQQSLYGVLSGCQVAAQGSPDMTVAVGSGVVVNNGSAVAVTSGNVTIVAAEAQARVDMVVVDGSGVKSAIKGSATTNSRCAVLPSGYVVLAFVYVPVGTTGINGARIVDKRIMLSSSFRRSSASGTDVILGLRTTGDAAERLSQLANGSLSWGDGTLSQDVTLSRSAANELTSNGNLIAKNFKRGTGSPEGVVTGIVGDLFVRTDGAWGTVLYVKETGSGNTGWYQIGGRKLVTLPYTWTISGPVSVQSGEVNYICPFWVPVPAGITPGQLAQTVWLSQAVHKLHSGGTATVTVTKNGSAITGLTNISVTTTKTVTDPADITLADQDELALVVSAVSSFPSNLSFSLNIFYLI